MRLARSSLILLAVALVMPSLVRSQDGNDRPGGEPSQVGPAASDPIASLRAAYRAGASVERILIEAVVNDQVVRRSTIDLALRREPTPALALVLGDSDPLRVIAGDGRLIVWRPSDPSRVFLSVLPDTIDSSSLERTLPPLMVPQIGLGLEEANTAVFGLLGETAWSRADGEQTDTYFGVAESGSIILRVDRSDRITGYTARVGAQTVLHARVEPLDQRRGVELFEPPDLEGTLVSSIVELDRGRKTPLANTPFGDGLGVDGRGRPTSVRAASNGAEHVVVLAIDARDRERRTRLAGALAEADLDRVARALDVNVVVVAIGEPRVATLLQRVVRGERGQLPRVSVVVLPQSPTWLTHTELEAQGVTFGIDGSSWVVRGRRAVGNSSFSARVDEEPMKASHAPRSLAEEITEAVGWAARTR